VTAWGEKKDRKKEKKKLHHPPGVFLAPGNVLFGEAIPKGLAMRRLKFASLGYSMQVESSQTFLPTDFPDQRMQKSAPQYLDSWAS